MATYQVQSNGLAPSGAAVGDIVNTAGGLYQITQPGMPGSSYNPSSGYWSRQLGADPLTDLYAWQTDQALSNTARSEAFAQHQMDFQTEANAKAMAFSAAEAQKNREWQEMMSNTAHQREVQDLIAAGLNPILSANSQGATTPSGASAAGVTGSGAMGTVDTSGASILSALIGGMMQKYSADTQYKSNQNTNYTNSQIARMQTDAGILNTAVSARAMEAAASISASATKYASDNALFGSMYSADQAAGASMYKTDKDVILQQYLKNEDHIMQNERLQQELTIEGLRTLSSMLNPLAFLGGSALRFI